MQNDTTPTKKGAKVVSVKKSSDEAHSNKIALESSTKKGNNATPKPTIQDNVDLKPILKKDNDRKLDVSGKSKTNETKKKRTTSSKNSSSTDVNEAISDTSESLDENFHESVKWKDSKLDRGCDLPFPHQIIPSQYGTVLCIPCACLPNLTQSFDPSYSDQSTMPQANYSASQPQTFRNYNQFDMYNGTYGFNPQVFPPQINAAPISSCPCEQNGSLNAYVQPNSCNRCCLPPPVSQSRRRCRREYYLEFPKDRCRVDEKKRSKEKQPSTLREEFTTPTTVTPRPTTSMSTKMPTSMHARPTHFPINFRLQQTSTQEPIINTSIKSSVNETFPHHEMNNSQKRNMLVNVSRKNFQKKKSDRVKWTNFSNTPNIHETAAFILRKKHNEIKKQAVEIMFQNAIEKMNQDFLINNLS